MTADEIKALRATLGSNVPALNIYANTTAQRAIVRLCDELLRMQSDCEKMARCIAIEIGPKTYSDVACARCVPNNTDVAAQNFVCAYHTALLYATEPSMAEIAHVLRLRRVAGEP